MDSRPSEKSDQNETQIDSEIVERFWWENLPLIDENEELTEIIAKRFKYR